METYIRVDRCRLVTAYVFIYVLQWDSNNTHSIPKRILKIWKKFSGRIQFLGFEHVLECIRNSQTLLWNLHLLVEIRGQTRDILDFLFVLMLKYFKIRNILNIMLFNLQYFSIERSYFSLRNLYFKMKFVPFIAVTYGE